MIFKHIFASSSALFNNLEALLEVACSTRYLQNILKKNTMMLDMSRIVGNMFIERFKERKISKNFYDFCLCSQLNSNMFLTILDISDIVVIFFRRFCKYLVELATSRSASKLLKRALEEANIILCSKITKVS